VENEKREVVKCKKKEKARPYCKQILQSKFLYQGQDGEQLLRVRDGGHSIKQRAGKTLQAGTVRRSAARVSVTAVRGYCREKKAACKKSTRQRLGPAPKK